MASNIEVASYDPKKVNLVMNGKIIKIGRAHV